VKFQSFRWSSRSISWLCFGRIWISHNWTQDRSSTGHDQRQAAALKKWDAFQFNPLDQGKKAEMPVWHQSHRKHQSSVLEWWNLDLWSWVDSVMPPTGWRRHESAIQVGVFLARRC
jgi:hypothetical protein